VKNFLNTIWALIAAVATIAIVQAVSGMIYPPPPGLDFQNQVEVARWANSMPVGAYLMVMLAYALGSFVGGLVVGRFVTAQQFIRAGIIGAFLMLAGFMNLAAIPHPLWFSVITTILFIPMALLGAKLGLASKSSKAAEKVETAELAQ